MSQQSQDPAANALAASRAERDRTLEAIHGLESALGVARESENWIDAVKSHLELLESTMTAEQEELNRPDSLLAMIASEHPRRFGPRIRSLREQYNDIIRQVSSLRRQLDDSDGGQVDPADVRHRAGWIIRALHHCRGRQADLVYDSLRLHLSERAE